MNELLNFLGFDEVEELEPKEESLLAKYRDGSRSTFLGLRSSS